MSLRPKRRRAAFDPLAHAPANLPFLDDGAMAAMFVLRADLEPVPLRLIGCTTKRWSATTSENGENIAVSGAVLIWSALAWQAWQRFGPLSGALHPRIALPFARPGDESQAKAAPGPLSGALHPRIALPFARPGDESQAKAAPGRRTPK